MTLRRNRNTVPYNTTKNNNLTVNVWRDWAANRNLQPETKQEPGYPIPVDLEQFRSCAEMDFWSQRFICEIERKKWRILSSNNFTKHCCKATTVFSTLNVTLLKLKILFFLSTSEYLLHACAS
jgi:hypothetical protein